MLTYNFISNWRQLHYHITIEEVVDFLHTHLDKFGDSMDAISKSIEYALSEEPGKGGLVVLARLEDELAGIVVMNKTGMADYIPEYILVYVAIREDLRGRGYGGELIKHVLSTVNSPVALHVEYDNPARHLYERIGFKSKYAEMRFNPMESYHDYP